jgi:hypothetical protein
MGINKWTLNYVLKEQPSGTLASLPIAMAHVFAQSCTTEMVIVEFVQY